MISFFWKFNHLQNIAKFILSERTISMIGIIYSRKSTIPCHLLEAFLVRNGYHVQCIDLDAKAPASLSSCRLLINTMGSFYPAKHFDLLAAYFKNGGNMIHLGGMPFTMDPSDNTKNIRALRSFGIVDDFCPIPQSCAYVKTQDGERLQASLTGMFGGVYHFCEQDNSGKLIRNAHLEHILDAFDENDELVGVPVFRIVTHCHGSMTFFAFDFAAEDLAQTFWQNLFLDVVRKEFLGNVLLSVDCSLSRYLPDEPKDITVSVSNISISDTCAHPLFLTLSVSDSNNATVYEEKAPVSLPFQMTFSPALSASSLYKVTVCIHTGSLCIEKKETGFLILTDAELEDTTGSFRQMYMDASVSSDYCLTDGKITPILGTTYFVTDAYRECFYNMNAWLCDREMSALKAIGFNVLRSGNWSYLPALYEADGALSLRGIRALQTYFLLAARHGFTVQFTLGNIMLNQWDTTRSPIHDPDMRKKCMVFVRSFTENFKSYKNVTLDIVNEPSYSMKGAWSPGKPSGEAQELLSYRAWLREQYHNDIHALQKAWGETSCTLRDFDCVQMPGPELFSRGLCRTEQRRNSTPLADFFAFARHEFLDWTAEVRAIVKSIAPDMLLTMGRDETLRIPAQQDEVLAGNIDMVCWHQWNYNSNILYEYLLNRVRGKICVAQELGMYKYDDIRAGKRYSDEEMARKLEKKLLYAFGNFVQWQAHDDPYMYELSENSLGLYRADMTKTPSLAATGRLIRTEKEMSPFLYGRQDDKIHIATVYNTSYYFSVDHPIAQQGIRSHVFALYNCLKEQADFIPEHLFKRENKSAVGSPALILLPAMQTLERTVWEELLAHVKAGAVLLISGCIDQDPHFAPDEKISTLDSSYFTGKLMNFEKIDIDGKEYVLDFRPVVGYADVSNLLNCGRFQDCASSSPSSVPAHTSGLREYAVGSGRILYCPYPLELSTNTEAVCACYEYAMKLADAHNSIYRIRDSRPNIVFTAASYEECTVYTLLNEGFADTVTWTDLRSNLTIRAHVEADSGCKLWLSKDGSVLGDFGHGSFSFSPFSS